MKARFSATFVTRVGAHTRRSRRFTGTLNSTECADLPSLVNGALLSLIREENLGEVHAIKITASVVRAKEDAA